MIWNLSDEIDYIVAIGPSIETPSREIRVVDIDSVASWIKKLAYATEHLEYPEGDSLIVKDARKFLEYLYA